MKNVKDRVHHYYNKHSLSPHLYVSPVMECTNQSEKTLLIDSSQNKKLGENAE